MLWGFFLLCSVSFSFWPLLPSLSQFCRILLMKCVQCCSGRTCHGDFFFILPACLIPSSSCKAPFPTKESDYWLWLKLIFLYMAHCFPQLNQTSTCFSEHRAILKVVKTQSSQDFLFTIVQHKHCREKETNEVFDNQFLSEMPWAEWGFSITISCSVAVHGFLFFFHLEVLILSLFWERLAYIWMLEIKTVPTWSGFLTIGIIFSCLILHVSPVR